MYRMMHPSPTVHNRIILDREHAIVCPEFVLEYKRFRRWTV